MCYLKLEIIVKFFNVVFHLLIKGTGAIPVYFRQVGIEHHLYPADGVYPRLEQILIGDIELCC